MDPSRSSVRERDHAVAARDEALQRVGRARRLAIVGSAGLSAGFAVLVSASPPSHATTTTKPLHAAGSSAPAPSRTAPPSAGAPALPPLPTGSQLGLSGPDQAPGAASGQPASPPNSQPTPDTQPAPQDQTAPQPQAPVSGGS